MRLPALAAALLAVLPAGLAATAARGDAIHATSVQLDAGDPGRVRVGKLRWLGGWALASRDRRFGGLSALVDVGGGQFLALSDTATPTRITMTAAGPVAHILPTLGPPGQAEAPKRERDSESLTHDPASGRFWAGYEGINAIVRYGPGLAEEARTRPAAMRDWEINGGPEALLRLADGRFMVIAEKMRSGPGGRRALMFPGDPTLPGATPFAFVYRPPDGYDPSDATQLPDGRLLVLNRRVSLMEGFTAVLTVVDPGAIRRGATVAGTEIARLAPPLVTDNFEGIAATSTGGRTIITLVSDDNFLPIERTLLLRFALED
ncbi:esterase-like activity of phytase family protein [Sphingomonas quercus]|uniref:Esterase-like activity of phytase family protein n=1 Tax=Sphingomonas quercus TaxID=2842451 RepID=A0ABS6BHW8_9SPHN|nr:esterase-like activity of phytase family protein [Sphingomonas quercus]MBU3077031.1 esterase-like activity of phytase family protein [Sphingomonas quercus]